MKFLAALLFFLASTGELKVNAKALKKHSESYQCSETVMQSHQLMHGCLWVRSQQKEFVQTLHAKVESLQSQFYIEYNENKIEFVNHSGVLKLTLRDGRSISVPAGFSIWVSEIQSNKKNLVGILQPVELKTHLQKLGALWPESKEEFKKEVGHFVDRWGRTEVMAAQYYESLVSRKIASIEATENEKIQRKRQQIEQRRRNQKLLFERAFSR